jgi:hypothetical protein
MGFYEHRNLGFHKRSKIVCRWVCGISRTLLLVLCWLVGWSLGWIISNYSHIFTHREDYLQLSLSKIYSCLSFYVTLHEYLPILCKGKLQANSLTLYRTEFNTLCLHVLINNVLLWIHFCKSLFGIYFFPTMEHHIEKLLFQDSWSRIWLCYYSRIYLMCIFI